MFSEEKWTLDSEQDKAVVVQTDIWISRVDGY